MKTATDMAHLCLVIPITLPIEMKGIVETRKETVIKEMGTTVTDLPGGTATNVSPPFSCFPR